MKLNSLHTRRRGGFTLVEIMIVVAIIALLAWIAVPGFLRARKRSQASRVINDLRLMDGAIDQYAIENNKTTNSTAAFTDLKVYLKKGGVLYNTGNDVLGNPYGPFTVDTLPRVPTPTRNAPPMWPTRPSGRPILNDNCQGRAVAGAARLLRSAAHPLRG